MFRDSLFYVPLAVWLCALLIVPLPLDAIAVAISGIDEVVHTGPWQWWQASWCVE